MRKIALLISLLLLPTGVWGAVVFDAANAGNTGSVKAASVSTTHTASGADRFAVVCAAVNLIVAPTANIGSCTYDGVGMTEQADTTESDIRVHTYTLVDPNTTTNASVSCTVAGENARASLVVMTFTGVLSSTPIDSVGIAQNTSTASLSANATTVTGGDLAVSCGFKRDNTEALVAGDTNPVTVRDETTTVSGTAVRNIRAGGGTREGQTGTVAMEWKSAAGELEDMVVHAFAVNVASTGRRRSAPIVVD